MKKLRIPVGSQPSLSESSKSPELLVSSARGFHLPVLRSNTSVSVERSSLK